MSLVLVCGHFTIADLEHVGVVPGSGFGVFLEGELFVEDACEGGETIRDVAGGAPGVGNWAGPGGGVLDAPLAHGVVDWTAGFV